MCPQKVGRAGELLVVKSMAHIHPGMLTDANPELIISVLFIKVYCLESITS